MKKVRLFIAMSLDGYIADRAGNVNWLTGQGEDDTVDAYSEFVKDIDTVVIWDGIPIIKSLQSFHQMSGFITILKLML